MAAVVGIVLVKSFDYRDNPAEEWSNKYWLTGNIPTTDADWKLLTDQLIAQEIVCYSASSKVVRALAYNDNAPGAHTVWTYDYLAAAQTVPGIMVGVEGNAFSGDQAGMVEWKTSRKSSRGKWIYLRKYFHDGFIDPADSDKLNSTAITNYSAFHTALQSGTWGGARRLRSQFNDEVLVTHAQIPWVTTRTLKRRGKRP